MFEKSLIVKYVATQTCFLYVPNSYKLDAGKCIKICYGTDEKLAYLSVSVPAIELEHHTVGLDSKFAIALGVREGELVHISEIADLPKITNLSIVPTSKEDYDILELLAENVQNTLLEHIRVVNAQQKIVIWIGKNLWVTVIVENVHPVCPGMMTELTEVIIKPTVDSIKSISDTCEVEDPGFSPNYKNPFLSSFLNLIYKKTFSTSNKHIKSTNTTFSNVHYFESIFRLIPLTLLNNVKCNDKLSYPFNVFLSKLSLGSKFSSVNSLVTPIFGSLNLLESSLNSPKEVFARVCFIEDCIEFRLIKKSYKENIFVSDTVFQYFQCTLGTRVILKQIEKFPMVNEIEIHSKKNYLEKIVDKFKLYLANVPLSPFILNSEIPLKLEENFTCSLKFLPNFPNRCLIDDDFLRNCKYSIQNEFVSVKEDIVKAECTGQYILNVANFETIINESVDVFSKNNMENIIISGKPGTGKSSLIKKISQQLEKYPYLIYTETIHSKKVKGKTIESLSKMLTTTVSKLILCQPSVLVLDDLHVLCENCTGEETPNSVYFNRVSEMLHNFLKLICKCNSIAVLATVESVSKLNKHIYKSRGSHLFKNHFSITEFSKLNRKSLLKQMFNKHVYEDISFDDLALKTEGFVIQDITDFFNKVVFESYKDAVDIEDVKSAISISHCEKALKNTCVLSLQNVQLHANGTKSFKDIGGLHKVKDVLVESLLWPVQYPTIFSNAPLRLQSGILLYGPPGTGKTLLAGAAATHCALRLISIKGPELLSKYIGASEQAVRDVFEKAQSARPCILFFDEFDSLAPRRGHDNTGVTDRVVNQLLTQLDGVESLSGVCVLAATSRPDLLDPALLRPGRLDRQLLCGLPNTEERMEILQVLSKNLELADDVRLTEIADSTQGFSGADLQSILYTAQLSSVNYLFENENSELQSSKITQNHLTEALYKTRPSLTRNERLKYERIYCKFQGGVVEDFKTGTKATLA